MELLRLHRTWLFVCLGAGLLALSWGSPGYAQTAAKSAAKEELPLNITADRLEVDQNQQVITFINKVVARYKDMILYSDTLKIFYQAKSEPASGKEKNISKAGTDATASPLGAVGIEKIIRLEAQGKVRIVQGDRVATGDKAIYYTQEEKIVLQGNPQLWRGENSLKGQEIVFYIKDNRAVVVGEPNKRVEAIIYPSQKVQLPGKQSAPSAGQSGPAGQP
jgi:lipopolysaccharide export system protein LptA